MRGHIHQAVERITYSLTDILTGVRPPISLHDAVAVAAPRPVLLIAAGDVRSEPIAGRFIQAASPSTVNLWVVPGSGHTDGLRTSPEE